MNRSILRVIAVSAALFTLVEISAAQQYRVEIVAEVGTVIDGYTIRDFRADSGVPQVNDRGEVVFAAHVTGPDGYNNYAVLTNRRIIAKVGDVIDGQVLIALEDEDIQPQINNHGQVAYFGHFAQFGLSPAIVFDNHIAVQDGIHIAGREIQSFNWFPRVDDLGRVLFWATGTSPAGDSVWGVFSQNEFVFHGWPNAQIGGEPILGLNQFFVNSSGRLTLQARVPDDTAFGGFAVATPDAILLRRGQRIGEDIYVGSIEYIEDVFDDGRILVSISTVRSDNSHVDVRTVLLPDVLDDFWTTLGVPRSGNRKAAPLPDGGYIVSYNDPATGDSAIFANGRRVFGEGDVLAGRVVDQFATQFFANHRGDFSMMVGYPEEDFHRPLAIVVATVIPEPAAVQLVITAIAASVTSMNLLRRMNRSAAPSSLTPDP